MLVLPFSLALLSLIPSVISSQDFKIYHRLARGHGDQPKPDFTLRGTVTLDDAGTAKYISDSLPKLDLGDGEFHDCCLYEVALETPGVQPEDWSFTSTKACFLSSRVSDSLAIVVNGKGTPISLNYHINDAPLSGACSSHGHSHHNHKHHHSPSESSKFALFANTTVSVRRPNALQLPILKAPPILTAEGKVFVPPPEQSFIQKYWIYAVPIIFLMLFLPEDDQGAPRASS
ncbi:hypothetical protein DL93DRAFT_430459 [Clavulina sp. PMI_390]|nr:hypothetical protein DL93DRAFT_430459 [Clavulina sp. PMI_390]